MKNKFARKTKMELRLDSLFERLSNFPFTHREIILWRWFGYCQARESSLSRYAQGRLTWPGAVNELEKIILAFETAKKKETATSVPSLP